tara:strand:- start:829 stop:1206 length:378 start_codon:yes stop_codon:yes gene_type:complete
MIFNDLKTNDTISLCKYFWLSIASIPLGIFLGAFMAVIVCVGYPIVGAWKCLKWIWKKIAGLPYTGIGAKPRKPSKCLKACDIFVEYAKAVKNKVCPIYRIVNENNETITEMYDYHLQKYSVRQE